jgi:carboxyl-terminal processing protease
MNRRGAFPGGAVPVILIAAVTRGLVILVLGLAAGVYIDQAFPEYVPYLGHRSVSGVDLSELQQAIRVVEADYVDGNVNAKKLSHGTVQGLIAGLGDPFSSYYDPEQYTKLKQRYEGRYSGIGIYLTFGKEYPVITGTVPGSPAAKAGLQAGDQIVKVGDKDLKGITSDQATALIQGPDGTKVTLEISRAGRSISVTLTRAEIHVPSVRSAVIANHILYVRIYQFETNTSTEFDSALRNGLPGAVGIVLDLRGDPGGFISAADEVITQFVSSGETFELRDRSGKVDRHEVGSKHAAPSLPLVVLVDANSASSAEIVAGSLQAHNRAKLVGTTTYGKGSVQRDFELTGGADIHLTVQRWYLPNGQTIDHKGLQPDVTVALGNPADAFDVASTSQNYSKDTQLLAALGLLPG